MFDVLGEGELASVIDEGGHAAKKGGWPRKNVLCVCVCVCAHVCVRAVKSNTHGNDTSRDALMFSVCLLYFAFEIMLMGALSHTHVDDDHHASIYILF